MYYWVYLNVEPLLRVAWVLLPWRKLTFLCRWLLIGGNFWVRVRGKCLLPPQCWDPIWMRLVQALPSLRSFCCILWHLHTTPQMALSFSCPSCYLLHLVLLFPPCSCPFFPPSIHDCILFLLPREVCPSQTLWLLRLCLAYRRFNSKIHIEVNTYHICLLGSELPP